MKKSTTAALLLAGSALILDSRWAAMCARDALSLCARVLIPSLFPLFAVSGMLVPELQRFRFSLLSRILGVPRGGEGFWLLGAAGGFPTGAAAISQAVQSGSLSVRDGSRMLGLCSQCGPAFLFGVLPQILPMDAVIVLFLFQMETSLVVAAFWPGASTGAVSSGAMSVSLPESVRRAVGSMLSVCAWVVLAAVAAGFGRKWLFPFLPDGVGTICAGLLELTNGIFALPPENRFLLSTIFVCFGGLSVLLQIGGLASAAGLPMAQCVLQKMLQGALGGLMAWLYNCAGTIVCFLPPAILFAKIMVEIPCSMVYNGRERKGFKCCFGKRWSSPASTAASAQRWVRT